MVTYTASVASPIEASITGNRDFPMMMMAAAPIDASDERFLFFFELEVNVFSIM